MRDPQLARTSAYPVNVQHSMVLPAPALAEGLYERAWFAKPPLPAGLGYVDVPQPKPAPRKMADWLPPPSDRRQAVTASITENTPKGPPAVPTLEDDTPHADNRTFAQLLADTIAERWAGRRSEDALPGQARMGLDALSLCLRPDLLGQPVEMRLKTCYVHEVASKHISAVVRFWKARALSPHLINRRLVCMSAMGFNVRGNYQRVPKKLKWWLKPDMEEKLRKTLLPHDPDFVDYMEWALHTGLRVEETLRLTRAHFSETLIKGSTRVEVTVPGTKTNDAEATLLLSAKAAEVYRRRFTSKAMPTARFLPLSYKQLQDRWGKYRYIIGAQGITDATLKAFRRNAARNLHVVAGMPLDLVRQYLRHEDVETTMGYLRLTGGYNTEEYARWL